MKPIDSANLAWLESNRFEPDTSLSDWQPNLRMTLYWIGVAGMAGCWLVGEWMFGFFFFFTVGWANGWPFGLSFQLVLSIVMTGYISLMLMTAALGAGARRNLRGHGGSQRRSSGISLHPLAIRCGRHHPVSEHHCVLGAVRLDLEGVPGRIRHLTRHAVIRDGHSSLRLVGAAPTAPKARCKAELRASGDRPAIGPGSGNRGGLRFPISSRARWGGRSARTKASSRNEGIVLRRARSARAGEFSRALFRRCTWRSNWPHHRICSAAQCSGRRTRTTSSRRPGWSVPGPESDCEGA